jgi:sensor histidine kinase YesM
MTTSNTPTNFTPPSKWQPFKDAFHDYARWLVSISWKLFAAIAFVAMMAGGMLLIPQVTFLFVVTSIVIKASYKQQIQAEEKATAATYWAEAEQLKRQLVEARLAAMQAQVEPHFLFNTLASIDHLIETDPPRASLMQKSLIALLRATLPSMRETGNPKLRNLGQELAVIRPYLDIQKMRMEDRLQILWDIPEGLNSAEMPHMMVLSLVENAFKHGLEPKAEGGTLTLRAEVSHGQLEVTIRDTGVGYYPEESTGATTQTRHGFGLKNIRDRLALIYGDQAQFSIRAMESFEGLGTLAKITVPYRVVPLEPQPAGV